MGVLKSLLARPAVQEVLATAAAAYIRLVFRTTRWRWEGRAHLEAALAKGPVIAAFWHARILMMPEAWQRPEPRQMLISPHRDGRLITRTIARFGVSSIEGSSRRDGSKALRRIVLALRAGITVGITPDGPRGPRMRAKPGLVAAARLAGVPILPVTFSTSRGRIFNSWDRFLLPLPWGRGVFLYGPPIDAHADAGDPETIRLRVEQVLNDLTEAADRAMGRAPIAPAPPPDPQSARADDDAA